MQLGLLGFWGEWHTYPHSEWIPGALRDAVVGAFGAAFSSTQVGGGVWGVSSEQEGGDRAQGEVEQAVVRREGGEGGMGRG